ncbi:MAG: hypoxanthine phosphoribosyltransferase [Bacteroidales bacterium]|nr:hypoxanthine phosphoribosyltransferase [Bacteroidales bacterium]
MNTIKIRNKEFGPFISESEIKKAVSRLANEINRDLKDKDVVFIGILNGAFMFASDLLRKVNLDCEITFVKLASYTGDTTRGKVKQLIGLGEQIKGKTVVILEDIVDTGITLDAIMKQLTGFEPEEILVVTLLFKPEALKKVVVLDYVGIEIPNDFVIGYGLDFDGFGRNLPGIYKIIK